MTRLDYVKGLFKFMKPYAIPYSIGLFLMGTQDFLISFILSTLNGMIMAAIIAESTRQVVLSSVVLIGMFVVYLVVVCVGLYLLFYNWARAIRDLKRKLFRAFVGSSLEKANASHSGEGIAAINTDADNASSIFGWVMRSMVTTLITIVFSSVVLSS